MAQGAVSSEICTLVLSYIRYISWRIVQRKLIKKSKQSTQVFILYMRWNFTGVFQNKTTILYMILFFCIKWSRASGGKMYPFICRIPARALILHLGFLSCTGTVWAYTWTNNEVSLNLIKRKSLPGLLINDKVPERCS